MFLLRYINNNSNVRASIVKGRDSSSLTDHRWLGWLEQSIANRLRFAVHIDEGTNVVNDNPA